MLYQRCAYGLLMFMCKNIRTSHQIYQSLSSQTWLVNDTNTCWQFAETLAADIFISTSATNIRWLQCISNMMSDDVEATSQNTSVLNRLAEKKKCYNIM